MDCKNSKQTNLTPWPGSHSLTKPLKEVNEILGVHYNTLYHWVKAGYIEHIRIGGSIHFTYDQVVDFVNKNRTLVKLKSEV